jgi:predicted nuclease of restriction endonuclease-like (RecB) superfamily
MGIFGFLSKAHLDQVAPSGEVAAKIERIDSSLVRERARITKSEQQLTQLDKGIDSIIERNNRAQTALQIRNQQKKERDQLAADMKDAQSNIEKLLDDKAPLMKSIREVRNEVGPIRFVSELIYGNDSEKDLESAIIAELQRFISELGSDFAFLARQKRITIDTTDYYIDLLFYHRRLKCLVAIDLKIGNFEASYKGQMELYLRYLEKYEQVEGENSPIGLILCSGKNEEHVELLQLDKSNIRVADYLTILPSQEVLKQKLHQAIELARNRFDSK